MKGRDSSFQRKLESSSENRRTINQVRDFVFTIEQAGDSQEFVVDFPDFPNIVTSGSTLTKAFHNACEALDLHLAAVERIEGQIPKPKWKLEVVNEG